MFAGNDAKIQFGSAFAIFLMWLLSFVPVHRAMRQTAEGFNHSNPRAQAAALTGYGGRMYAAHADTLEHFVFLGFGLWANAAGFGNMRAANAFALIVAIARFLYFVAAHFDRSKLRAAMWGISWFSILGLFITPFAS
ncbi:hypothetical protein GQ42DRAFT_153259 [Ramicandelaber brevisporus]|nr:hypothetical protein GQ42DRAFT_157408 [Ramicandelaber brevisporus]KAI8871754.1 hypothetical protein GQ42DRAFT_90299 [Ramicandelaber brevisporus]KAI8872876.1 hypothetical protein GQ42DRAFT_153259 [Ramicandelaber brevisporus]